MLLISIGEFESKLGYITFLVDIWKKMIIEKDSNRLSEKKASHLIDVLFEEMSLSFYPPLHEKYKGRWFRGTRDPNYPPDYYVCLNCFNVVNYNRSRFCPKCGVEVSLEGYNIEEIPEKSLLERLIDREKVYEKYHMHTK